MASEVFVLATSSTRFGRLPEASFSELAATVTRQVLADARLGSGVEEDLGAEIGSSWFGNCLMHAWEQTNVRGQMCLTSSVEAGLIPLGVPITNVEAACATGSVALHGAIKDVRSGDADVSLAIAVERMSGVPAADGIEQRSRSLQLLRGSTDNLHFARIAETYRDAGRQVGVDFAPAAGRSMFMDTYAIQALLHMQKYGTTKEQVAAGCAKNHQYGALNPLAQYQQAMTVEDVLADVVVTEPFTRAMCAPVGDGAAAALVVSGDWLAAQPEAVRSRALLVRAHAASSGSYLRRSGEPTLTATAAQRAYARAGLKPTDIDVVELHDATSFGEILQAEMLGLCEPGQGGPFVADGATGPGGVVPVNTSGGLVSKGHPIGATGLSMLHEIGLQLRGEAGERQVPEARIGLVENGGGVLGLEEAACAITILERNS